jgi:hypothetical protein
VNKLHDVLGRFARTGAVRVERTEPRTRKLNVAVPEKAARSRWDHTRDRVDAVNEAQARHINGEKVTDPALMDLLYSRGRTAQPGRREEPVLGRREALGRAAKVRGVKGAGFRYATKRTSTGKAVVERGHKSRAFDDGWILGFGSRTRVVNGAGKKQNMTTRTARSVFTAGSKAYSPRHSAG